MTQFCGPLLSAPLGQRTADRGSSQQDYFCTRSRRPRQRVPSDTRTYSYWEWSQVFNSAKTITSTSGEPNADGTEDRLRPRDAVKHGRRVFHRWLVRAHEVQGAGIGVSTSSCSTPPAESTSQPQMTGDPGAPPSNDGFCPWWEWWWWWWWWGFPVLSLQAPRLHRRGTFRKQAASCWMVAFVQASPVATPGNGELLRPLQGEALFRGLVPGRLRADSVSSLNALAVSVLPDVSVLAEATLLKGLCSRACVLRLVPCCFFLLGHGGRDPRFSAREEVGSPHLPPKKTKTTNFLQGWAGGAESAGLPSSSHPPALSQRPPCTRALCARSHKTKYPLDTKCMLYLAPVQPQVFLFANNLAEDDFLCGLKPEANPHKALDEIYPASDMFRTHATKICGETFPGGSFSGGGAPFPGAPFPGGPVSGGLHIRRGPFPGAPFLGGLHFGRSTSLCWRGSIPR